ncbi:hypothetical protein ONS96_008349 [Cadophora gregata f. sp. sojae]|nr:hypothetical protein ONS96_008349 [Cadophora gregata f. sp. sojae]
MEHLGIPEEHRSRSIRVPYLGLAPRYDGQGLIGFPERHGFRSEQLSTYCGRLFQPRENADALPFNPEFVESFFQEWLWFGMLDEFALACGVPLDIDLFIKMGVDERQIIDTEPLLPYVRSVVIEQLIQRDVPLDLEVGDSVYIRSERSPSSVPSRHTTFRGDLTGVNLSIPDHLQPLGASSVHTKASTPGAEIQNSPPIPREIKKDVGNFRYTLDASQGESDSWPVTTLIRADQTQTSDLPCILAKHEDVPLQNLLSMIMGSEAYHQTQSKDRFSRFENCLREVRNTMRPALLCFDTIHRLEIAFSIDLLCDNLMYVMLNLFKMPMAIKGPWFDFYMSRFEDRVKAENWCIARTSSVLPFDITALYFKSVLPSYESIPHLDCGPTSCSRQSHDVNSLQVQHDWTMCHGDCQVLALDEQKLIGILESNGIPGLYCIETEGGVVDFEVIDITGKEYITISHVWSHGLGNPNQNSLPMCQVKRLFRYIRNVGSAKVILWIDTLSVPISLKYKRIAITKLREVYQKAHGVLVIDRHLIRVGRNALERKVQLLCSEWMRRLWTLQEGRLATRLYIQYQHEPISIDALCQVDEVPSDTFVFGDINHRASLAIRLHFAQQESLIRRFMDLTIDMAHRSVTVPTDEPICLATMLGLPLEQFKPYPTMDDIYRSLPELPPDLLFLENPKLNIDGFRWAPSTFLNQDAQDYHDSTDDDTAQLTDEGLRIRRSCIIFKNELQFSDSSQDYLVRKGSDITFLFYDNQGKRGGSFSNAAIVLNDTSLEFSYFIRAILVDGLVLRDGIYYCRIRRYLMVRKWNGLAEEADEFDTGREERYTFDGEFRQGETFCVD